MKTFKIEFIKENRIVYDTYSIEIQAETEKEAERIILENEYNEDDAEYEDTDNNNSDKIEILSIGLLHDDEEKEQVFDVNIEMEVRKIYTYPIKVTAKSEKEAIESLNEEDYSEILKTIDKSDYPSKEIYVRRISAFVIKK